MRDRLSGHLTVAVGAGLDFLEGGINFKKGIALLGKKAEGEVAVIGIAACVRRMHSKGGGFASIGTGA